MTIQPASQDGASVYRGFAEKPAIIEKLFRRLDGLPNPDKRDLIKAARALGVLCEISALRLIRDLGLR